MCQHRNSIRRGRLWVVHLLALVLMDRSIRKNGVVLPSVFSKLGDLLVPLIIAVIFSVKDRRYFRLSVQYCCCCFGRAFAVQGKVEKESVDCNFSNSRCSCVAEYLK